MNKDVRNLKLPYPPEPEEVKKWIRNMEMHTGGGKNWDSLDVWYGNQLPKYLWDQWKDELKPTGFTWQKFLKLLSRRTDSILLWYKGAHSWEVFVKSVIDLIKGPLGQDLAER